MPARSNRAAAVRKPLTRERVLACAVDVADSGGLEAVTMRHLAESLGVEAMSLYHHVANKEAILDGITDVIVSEIIDAVAAMTSTGGWHSEMRATILAARTVLLRHPWAPAVFESRTSISPSMASYFNDLLRIFRDGGFSYDLAHHALHALGSRAIGFAQEMFQPDQQTDEDASDDMLEQMADALPYLVEMMMEIAHDDPDSTLGWCDDQSEFEFALDLMLDGLDRLRIAD